MNSIGPLKSLRVRLCVSRIKLDFVANKNPELLWPRRNDNRIDLKIYDAIARGHVIKTKKIFIEDNNYTLLIIIMQQNKSFISLTVFTISDST